MFDRTEYEGRLARLRAAVTDSGADVMIVDESELLGWLTGYMPSETMYRAALVPLDGEPWYVVRNLSTTLRHSPLQFTVQDLLSLDWVG